VRTGPMGAAPSTPTAAQREELQRRRDEIIERAACALARSDAILLMTGAGWSADSGLAVYADVANVQAYHEKSLTYRDLCQPSWLHDDPALFYGFWGQCFNDYRSAAPHEGYRIVARWRDELCMRSSAAEALRARCGTPGAFFSFTSNVDAHSLHHFSPLEVRECHGNAETWQCANRRCAAAPASPEGVPEERTGSPPDEKTLPIRWGAPAGFRFAVDGETALAPQGPPGSAASGASCEEAAAFASNWPTCLHCGGAARPSILMFSDIAWHDDEEQEARWEAWREAVKALARDRPSFRLTVVEVGAGGNVTTVRNLAEEVLADVRESATATLVRINPELPLADRKENQEHTFSVLSNGLEAIRAIDEAMQRVRMEMKVGDVEEGALPPKLHTVLESTPEKKEGVVNPLLDAESLSLFKQLDELNAQLGQELEDTSLA